MTIDIQPEDEAVFNRLGSNGRITHELRRLITQQWNKCSVCGADIPKGRPAFAGYDSKSNPLFVGCCCAAGLQELATPVYWSESFDISVRDTQSVWRYMDFAKFISMLQQKGLYFVRADLFEDRFEGATGLASRQASWDEFYLDWFREIVVSAPAGYSVPEYTTEQIDGSAGNLLQSLKTAALKPRQQLVSCWHGNENEAEALWRLYTPPSTPGVAIKSTAAKLWDACAQYDNAIVGRVHYVDFKRSFASIQPERIFQKRVSLSHEHEVRIALPNDLQSLDGKVLACDLERLITQVVISPFAPSWFLSVVADVTRVYGYSFELKQSELLDEPFF